jgi:hypothetical protein
LSGLGRLPKKVPVVDGIVVATPGDSIVSRIAQTGTVMPCPGNFFAGGGMNRELCGITVECRRIK